MREMLVCKGKGKLGKRHKWIMSYLKERIIHFYKNNDLYFLSIFWNYVIGSAKIYFHLKCSKVLSGLIDIPS